MPQVVGILLGVFLLVVGIFWRWYNNLIILLNENFSLLTVYKI